MAIVMQASVIVQQDLCQMILVNAWTLMNVKSLVTAHNYAKIQVVHIPAVVTKVSKCDLMDLVRYCSKLLIFYGQKLFHKHFQFAFVFVLVENVTG